MRPASFAIKSTYETNFAPLVQDKFNESPEATASIEDPIVDYTLRCIKGLFRGRFFYLNLTPEGEVFGSDQSENLTMYIENSNLSPIHAEITYDYTTKKYQLVDMNSKTGTWIAFSSEYPLGISDDMEIRIADVIYKFKYLDVENDITDWLERLKIDNVTSKLKEFGVTQLQHLSKLNEEKIDSLGLNEYQKSSLQQAINDLNLDYPEKNGYVKQKIKLFVIKKFDKEGVLVNVEPDSPDYKEKIVGWQGAVLGNKTMSCDFQIAAGADLFELYIKFQYGHYWLIGPPFIQRVEVFYRLKKGDKYILQPDNIIEMGDIQFVVQRFNTGAYEDKGTRHSMEDCSVIKHDIGVSELMNVSFYAVYDGHGGSECVTYIAQQLIYNLRTAILKGEPFEECTNFYRYIHDRLLEAFNITDANYFNEFEPFYSLNCGSTACVVIIAGDRIISANIGDSRAILCRNGEALNLTRDHKPDTPDELARIKNAGGFVATRRLLGKLAVSRSFGDFGYKRVGGSDIFKSIQGEGDLVLSVPEIRETRINYLTDEFILLGCDGLYDVFTSMECVTFVREKLGQMPIGEQDPQAVAGELVRTAIKNSTLSHKHSDNVSVIIVCLTRGITTSFDQTIIKK